ncbi:hypothetical protein FACS1894130_00170 [Spirochaetia bacterium]|nr:hypothetical protein FACS1894130_00170 [Spirochaetia bacterium]
MIFVFFEGGFYNSYISKYLVKINLNNILETYATDGNKDCPVAVGNDLVIEKISFVETKTIRYEFHVPKYSKDSLYLQPYKEFLTEINIEDLENTKSLAKLRNNDVIFEYLYFDNRGEEMFNIRVLFNTPITVID